eukprot:gene18154-36951_t
MPTPPELVVRTYMPRATAGSKFPIPTAAGRVVTLDVSARPCVANRKPNSFGRDPWSCCLTTSPTEVAPPTVYPVSAAARPTPTTVAVAPTAAAPANFNRFRRVDAASAGGSCGRAGVECSSDSRRARNAAISRRRSTVSVGSGASGSSIAAVAGRGVGRLAMPHLARRRRARTSASGTHPAAPGTHAPDAGRNANRAGRPVLAGSVSMTGSLVTVDDINAFLERDFSGNGNRCEAVGERWATAFLPTDAVNLRPGGIISGPTVFGICDAALYY